MSFDIFILACGGFLTGRYIGARRDKSGPTAVRIISSKSIIGPVGLLLVYTHFIHPSSFLLTMVYWDILNKLLYKKKGTHASMTSKAEQLAAEIQRIKKGGAEKYPARNREQKKLFARDRLKLLLDDGKIEFEDGMFAECQNPEMPADGSITGVGRIHGRPVAFSASDSTVKAGSAGEKSVKQAFLSRKLR